MTKVFYVHLLILTSLILINGKDARKKPHILMVVADDLGFNDVPWHNTHVVAPTLNKLAQEGVVLEQNYVQPICSPTRSALLSGRYPFEIGRQHDVIWSLMPSGLNRSLPIIPEYLKPLGYSTHAVGKWHLGFCNWDYTPTRRGFDSFKGYYTGSEDYYTHQKQWAATFDLNPPHWRENKTRPIHNGYDFRNNEDVDLKARGTYSTYEFAGRVEEILESSSSTVPKFIYLAFQSVHAPLQVPDEYVKPYQYIKDDKRRTYLGMVSALDDAMGRVVKKLKETGHYENTVIIFTSDNGGPTIYGANNWPLRGNKTTVWEGGTRAAGFVHSPLLFNQGTTCTGLIHVTDWLSTIVSLAGGTPPQITSGFNQWDAISGLSNKTIRNEIVYNIDKTLPIVAAIRNEKYKLIIGHPGPGDWTPPPEIQISVESNLNFNIDNSNISENFTNADIAQSNNSTIAGLNYINYEIQEDNMPRKDSNEILTNNESAGKDNTPFLQINQNYEENRDLSDINNPVSDIDWSKKIGNDVKLYKPQLKHNNKLQAEKDDAKHIANIGERSNIGRDIESLHKKPKLDDSENRLKTGQMVEEVADDVLPGKSKFASNFVIRKLNDVAKQEKEKSNNAKFIKSKEKPVKRLKLYNNLPVELKRFCSKNLILCTEKYEKYLKPVFLRSRRKNKTSQKYFKVTQKLRILPKKLFSTPTETVDSVILMKPQNKTESKKYKDDEKADNHNTDKKEAAKEYEDEKENGKEERFEKIKEDENKTNEKNNLFFALLSGDKFDQSKFSVRLYDLQRDPEERKDLARELPEIVRELIEQLLKYDDKYVEPDVPPNDPAGYPENFGGVWSPGWC